MTVRINGAASSHQNLTGSLQCFVMYATSLGAYTCPDPNPCESEWLIRGVNILVTDNILDQSQKNFEILLQSIGLRAMPTVMNNPCPVMCLEEHCAPTLVGEGYVWKFAVEFGDAFMDYSVNNPVGLLIRELDGVIIESGVRLTTVDDSCCGHIKNIEFIRVCEL